MNFNLFTSILAMDSYNRGYDPGIGGLVNTTIGSATIDNVVPLSVDNWQGAGFFASSYTWNGATVISYRGTDNSEIFNRASDLWNGWTVGAGYAGSSQAKLAIDFYVAATGITVTVAKIP